MSETERLARQENIDPSALREALRNAHPDASPNEVFMAAREIEERRATVIGYVDRLGYLYCLPCWLAVQMDQRPDAEGYPWPVRAGVAPHDVEPCERCGRRLVDAVRGDQGATR